MTCHGQDPEQSVAPPELDLTPRHEGAAIIQLLVLLNHLVRDCHVLLEELNKSFFLLFSEPRHHLYITCISQSLLHFVIELV